MKNRLLGIIALSLVLISCASGGKNTLAGDWSGTLNMGGANLRLVFHILESDAGYSASIESVDQGGAIIPTTMEVNGNALVFVVEQIDVEYRARVSGNEIVGEFSQFGMTMPNFTLRRNR